MKEEVEPAMIRLLVTLSLLASTAQALTPAAPPQATEPAPVEAALLIPPSTPELATALPAIGVIATLAAVALYLSRRRPGSGRRLVQVLETASLGPRRQLVVVRLGDDVLLLGSSEAGVTLLSTQPALAGLGAPAAPAQAPAHAPTPVTRLVEPAPERTASILDRLWTRLAARTPAPAKASFEDLLIESSDDQELRRKLASGRPGKVA